MYQVSRAIYRELARDIAGGRDEHEAVLHTCEATIERMVADAHYFARPARTLWTRTATRCSAVRRRAAARRASASRCT